MNSFNSTDKFDNELITTILTAQVERRNEQRQAVISANPWLANVRAMQIKLQKEGSN